LDAVHAGHVQVEQSNVAAGLAGFDQSFLAVGGRHHSHAVSAKSVRQGISQLIVVIDDQQFDRRIS
jgi:hypothetical protein